MDLPKFMTALSIGIDASNLQRGGGQSHLIELLSATNKISFRKFTLYIWCSSSLAAKLPSYPWIHICRSELIDRNVFFRFFWQLFLLGRSARMKGCDILLVPGGCFFTNFRPIVVMSQNLLPFEFKELFRYGLSLLTLKFLVLRLIQAKSFRSANGIIFLSNYAKSCVTRSISFSPPASCIIPHGVSNRFFGGYSYEPQHNTVQIRVFDFTLVYVSIVDQYKHHANVVTAVSKVRDETALNLKLVLAGPAYPPALERLQSAINSHDPLGQWVSYLGQVDYNTIHSLYQQSDIGIFASTCENLPIILLEMMASKLPIVCSSYGPMPEVIGDSAIFFDPLIPDTLSKAILSLLSDDHLRARLAESAFHRACQYSWEHCAESTFNFLHEVSLAYSDVLVSKRFPVETHSN
jgi:glycosyltransferase involved in cell wall biosynthesis